jgi:hypothetical protein
MPTSRRSPSIQQQALLQEQALVSVASELGKIPQVNIIS